MDNGNPAATVLGLLHFGNGGQQEQHLSIAGRRQARAEPPGKASLGFRLHRRFFVLPLSSKGGIGQHIIKGLAFELVIRQGIAILDEIGVVTLDEHICFANGKRLIVQFLTKGHQLSGGVQLVKILFRHRQHTTSSTGRVIDGLYHIVARQHIVVIVEQDVDHQLDYFSGGVVLPGVLVVGLGKPADDLLKDVAHFQIGDRIWVQVGLGGGKLLDDNVKDTFVGHCGDLTVKLELFQDVLDILREAVQVVPEIRLDIVRVVQQPLKGKLAGVIKRLPGGVAQ